MVCVVVCYTMASGFSVLSFSFSACLSDFLWPTTPTPVRNIAANTAAIQIYQQRLTIIKGRKHLHRTGNPNAVHWAALYPASCAGGGAIESESCTMKPIRLASLVTIRSNTMVEIVTPNDVPICERGEHMIEQSGRMGPYLGHGLEQCSGNTLLVRQSHFGYEDHPRCKNKIGPEDA